MATTKLTEYWKKRDFLRTPEPRGAAAGARGSGPLRFVVQKHAASHLHYDLRLELDGVMKSWAVPKGPSLDPAVRRLAMQVEDHPVEYNTFEGIIPKGEYGGGTVMLWDRGGYSAGANSREDDEEVLRQAYAEGRLEILMYGERLQGAFTLVRTGGGGGRPQWLLMKRRDLLARPGGDITAEEGSSVDSGRSMDEIAASKSRVWRSNRGGHAGGEEAATEAVEAPAAATPGAALAPMLATIGDEVPAGPGWTFEPKYDGVRVLAYVTSEGARLLSRNGNDKTAQFPEVAAALRGLAAGGAALVLDGEIVALRDDAPARFQDLQGRMHRKDKDAIAEGAERAPAALVAFDLLLDGDEVLLAEPWRARRRRLEQRLRGRASPRLLLGETHPDAEALLRRAAAEGWEGVLAKQIDAPYEPGARTRAWRKLKLEHRQELVVGGFTAPRGTRTHFGALLLGYFEGDALRYAGHTGGGFDADSLAAVAARLRPLARKTCPFAETPRPNQPVRWVSPTVVVEVKFSEWTEEGRLRQPIFLGMRDDKDARAIVREPESVQGAAPRPSRTGSSRPPNRGRKRLARGRGAPAALPALIDRLDEIERGGGGGALALPGGAALEVSRLDKVFFPKDGFTKGDVMRYYARVAKVLLPLLADRALVLRRFPDGIDGPSFYQQRAPDEAPPGVRVEELPTDRGPERRLVGGALATLLYGVQLGGVSVDPWHSRVSSLDSADYAIVDLDPGPDATMRRIIDVARWVKDELDALGLHAALKTSGSRGLHIAVPLAPGTPNEAALLCAELVATRVAAAHPKEATVARALKARPAAAVYVDYLQNVLGKTVAAAYCVRARPGATVSTPLRWEELTDDLDPRAFTVATVPPRIEAEGDLWAAALRRRSSLRAVLGRKRR